jgi:antitoxin (DNA-binding transcriptional repressor) of toxin-antitoxin stability system
MNASIVDLRYRMKDVLRAIDRGESVKIFYRGKEKAMLTPIATAPHLTAAKTVDQPIFGIWRDREDLKDPVSWVRNQRLPRQVLTQSDVKKHARARKSK